MPQTYEMLRVPFSTADAEYPSIVFRNANLNLEFIDWHEQTVRVAFRDVAAFRWDDEQEYDPSVRDDSCYVVHGSAWIEKHLRLGTFEASHGHKHYKLCFNACGVLDVLATGYEVAKYSWCGSCTAAPQEPNNGGAVQLLP